MRIQSTFTVTLESADENAEFIFKKPKANKIYELQKVEDDVKRNFYMLTDYLVSVKGLYDEDGKEITVDAIKDLDLDLTTIRAIVEGYNAGAFPKSEQDPEKKDS